MQDQNTVIEMIQKYNSSCRMKGVTHRALHSRSKRMKYHNWMCQQRSAFHSTVLPLSLVLIGISLSTCCPRLQHNQCWYALCWYFLTVPRVACYNNQLSLWRKSSPRMPEIFYITFDKIWKKAKPKYYLYYSTVPQLECYLCCSARSESDYRY
jgi:hypothetical protein